MLEAIGTNLEFTAVMPSNQYSQTIGGGAG